jgi:hypothetical protein
MKIYSNQELKDMQLSGAQPTYEWDLLNTKYKDRWEKARDVCKRLTSDPSRFIQDHIINHRTFSPTKPHHNCNETKITQERFHHTNTHINYQGPVYGYSDDYYFKEPYENKSINMWDDYARRVKLLISHGSRETYNDYELNIPEFEYWLDFYDDVHPIITQMAAQAFQTMDFIIRLSIIEYSYPTATKENYIEKREFCTQAFGDPHIDETLGAWHLGENQNEFWMENTKTNEWESVPDFENGNTVWMFGDKQEDWIPTTHGMKHNPDPSHGVRYSLIANVQPYIASQWSK